MTASDPQNVSDTTNASDPKDGPAAESPSDKDSATSAEPRDGAEQATTHTSGEAKETDGSAATSGGDGPANDTAPFGKRTERPTDSAESTDAGAHADNDARAEADGEPADETGEGHGWGKSTIAALRSALGGGSKADAVADEIEKLVSENADLKERMLRIAADMENLRKRTEREKADTAKYAVSRFAEDMLSVGDNLSRALTAVPEDMDDKDAALRTLRDGIAMTGQELDKKLEKHGVVKDDPKGEVFDPNKHQAISQIPDENVPAGHITDVFQTGYMIADRVLRPAMVVVSQGIPKVAAAEGSADEGPTSGET
ncbi:MAG: nucleotide exchange factor GrpE [Pseudomonadota bacterium]